MGIFPFEYHNSPPPNTPQDYCITLDLENKMFEVEHEEYRVKEKANFSELGFGVFSV